MISSARQSRWASRSGREADSRRRSRPQLDEFVDGGVEVIGEFEVGDPIDLPADPAGIPIAALVTLRVEPATVPGDVIDLDRPS